MTATDTNKNKNVRLITCIHLTQSRRPVIQLRLFWNRASASSAPWSFSPRPQTVCLQLISLRSTGTNPSTTSNTSWPRGSNRIRGRNLSPNAYGATFLATKSSIFFVL